MNKFLLFALCVLIPSSLFSQANCSNPAQVTLCPAMTLTNQTNAGMLDDSPAPCNIAGEDLVYEIFAPNGALHIYVSLINASGACRLTMKSANCLSSACYTRTAYAGNSNHSFTVPQSNYYYLWIDAASTITFDISIGGDTLGQYVYIPNIQGLLQVDNCAPNPFSSAKRFLEVSYNGAFKTQPMTLSPLNSAGVMCIAFYLRNTTGVTGLKKVNISFGSGLTNVSPVVTTIPGNYNSGDWVASGSGQNHTFTFNDSAGIGRGDFDSIPNTCLRYEFCFNLTPVNNIPSLTNVLITIFNDTYGMGYSGMVYSGCCPSGMPNCLSGWGGATGGSSGMSFSFNDPGVLPVTLIDFNAKKINERVILEWSTASEVNCDYFTIERSNDITEWKELTTVRGSGNSTVTNYYSALDEKPLKGESYYRLTQTDYDGVTEILKTETITFNSNYIKIYPNPADKHLIIEGESENLFLINSTGNKIPVKINNGILNTEFLPNGIYMIQTIDAGKVINERVVIQH